MVKTKRTKDDLSPQEQLFVEKYCEIGGDFYSNGTGAAKAAKYSEKSAHSTAWRLLRRPAIRAAINQTHQENMSEASLTPERILCDIEDVRRRALLKHDLPSALRASELMGKTLAMFTDRYSSVEERAEQREFTDAEKEGLRKLADKVAQEAIEANRAKIGQAESFSDAEILNG